MRRARSVRHAVGRSSSLSLSFIAHSFCASAPAPALLLPIPHPQCLPSLSPPPSPDLHGPQQPRALRPLLGTASGPGPSTDTGCGAGGVCGRQRLQLPAVGGKARAGAACAISLSLAGWQLSQHRTTEERSERPGRKTRRGEGKTECLSVTVNSTNAHQHTSKHSLQRPPRRRIVPTVFSNLSSVPPSAAPHPNNIIPPPSPPSSFSPLPRPRSRRAAPSYPWPCS